MPQITSKQNTLLSELSFLSIEKKYSSPSLLPKRTSFFVLALLASHGVNATPSSKDCSITAWIAQSHGFVKFECASMTETLGFYPDLSQSNALQEEANDRTRVNKGSHLSYISESQSFLGINTHSSSVKYANITEKLPFIIGSLDLSRFYTARSSGFKLISTVLPSYYLHGSRPSIKHVPARIVNDAMAYTRCRFGSEPCMYITVHVNYDIAMKAYQKVESIHNATELFKQQKCQKDPLDHQGHYNLLSQNCIDFVRQVMDSTGVSNWKEKMSYTSNPSIIEKIQAVAWHYFNWT